RQRPRHAPGALPDRACGLVRGRGLEPGVDAAVLAARIVPWSVLLPLDSLEQGVVGREDSVSEQVAGALPAVRVARDRTPRRARELAFAGQELLVDRRSEPPISALPRDLADDAELLLVLGPRHRQVLVDLRILVARRD